MKISVLKPTFNFFRTILVQVKTSKKEGLAISLIYLKNKKKILKTCTILKLFSSVLKYKYIYIFKFSPSLWNSSYWKDREFLYLFIFIFYLFLRGKYQKGKKKKKKRRKKKEKQT